MKILAFGEIMMRLNPPIYKRLGQSEELKMSFTGTGLNLLSGLSVNGFKTSMLTVLPSNNVGKVAASQVRKLNISDKNIIYEGNHIGVYFLELGYGNRPSEVTYLNRKNSSFGEYILKEEEVLKSLEEIDLIHICGISLSISEVTRKNAILVAKKAWENNIDICFDFNYRSSLNDENNRDDLVAAYNELLKYSKYVFGSVRDLRELLGLDANNDKELIKKFLNQYDVECFSGTIRRTEGTEKFIKGYIYNEDGYIESSEKEISMLDRIGTGDAYASGVLTGLLKKWDVKKIVEYAIVCCELAHTIEGDVPILDQKFVENYMNSKADIIR